MLRKTYKKCINLSASAPLCLIQIDIQMQKSINSYLYRIISNTPIEYFIFSITFSISGMHQDCI